MEKLHAQAVLTLKTKHKQRSPLEKMEIVPPVA